MPSETPAWLLQQLRITLFSPLIGVQVGEGLIKAIVGEDPLQSAKNVGALEEATAIEGGKEWLVTRASPTRVDLVLSSPPDESANETVAYPALEPVRMYGERATQWGAALLESLKLEPSRIAVGVVAVIPAASKEAAYRQLAKILDGSVTLDPLGSDFLYQINRTRSATFGGERVELNRLAKWSAALIQRVQVILTMGAQPQVIQNAVGHYASRLELDMSTDAARQTLPSGTGSEIVGKLFTLAAEIADEGDIK